MHRIALATTIAVTLSACYAGTYGRAVSDGDRSTLLAAEIDRAPDISSALDAVRRLRPEYLRNRGPTSIRSPVPTPIIVYLNGVPAGGVDLLANIPAIDIKMIRYLSGPDATTRYGTGHGGGVLEVSTGNR